MLFIQLYPLKLFHQLLDVLHVRKQVLISLGDVFTGSYKNSCNRKLDYRYFAGFYFLLRIIILSLHFYKYELSIVVLISQCIVFGVFGGMIMIFRPHTKKIHNFNEFIIVLSLFISSITSLYVPPLSFDYIFFFIPFCCFFYLILMGYSIYHIVKMMWNCHHYCKSNRPPKPLPVDDDTDDDNGRKMVEFADRMENPDDYDEHHSQDIPYSHYPILNEDESDETSFT
jgi:hypothetical protein